MEGHQNKNAIGWFEIYVQDMNKAKSFYENVFQRKLENLVSPEGDAHGLEMWSFKGEMSTYGSNGALVKMDGFSSGKNSVIVYFNCDDCAYEEGRVREFGGRVEKPKFSIGQYGFCSLVCDVDGNMIGLHSQK